MKFIKDMKVPVSELESRMQRFRVNMDKFNSGWELAVIFSKLNQFYFTGTMQDAMLLIPSNGEAILWVRRSFDRALDESLFPNIKPMESYKDAAAGTGKIPSNIYIETEIVPVAIIQRFKKYFPFNEAKPLDLQIGITRAIKSPYEIALMEESGKIHKRVLEDIVPTILKEGMSEVELVTKIYSSLVEQGHQGISRFSMFDTEMGIGQIGFGENSLYPTYFNGPGGNRGSSPAIPFIGSNERKLKKGDLVFVDIGCGYEGYHTDKTMTYMFGKKLPQEAIDIHKQCIDIQYKMAEMLKPGKIPSQIYEEILGSLSPEFQENFMGYGNRKVKFLGHGIGLVIDEIPVIAKGFDDPLVEGIAFAIEPKKGVKGIGMVGIENTFLVTSNGGKCITGTNPGLISINN